MSEPVGPVRFTSANCFAGDHDECLGMVEQDVAELGITDCLCWCHGRAAHPADSAEALLRALDLLRRVVHHKPWWNGQDKLWSDIYAFVRDFDDEAQASAPSPAAEPRDCDHDDIESTFSLDEPPGQREEWLYCRACNTHRQPRAGVLKLLEQRAAVEPPPDPLDVAHARGFREGHRAAAEGSEPSSD